MKAEPENKTKSRVAIVLVIVAILAVGWQLMPRDTTPSPTTTSAVVPAVKGQVQVSESIDPRLRLDLLASAEEVKYEAKGKNIFSIAPEPVVIEKVKVPPLKPQQVQAPVYVPPPPPPITLKFFGTTNAKGEKPKAFLSQGEDVWIAHEGDVVNRHYKIVRISPNAVEVEDLLNNNRQSIPLTQG